MVKDLELIAAKCMVMQPSVAVVLYALLASIQSGDREALSGLVELSVRHTRELGSKAKPGNDNTQAKKPHSDTDFLAGLGIKLDGDLP